MFNQSLNIVRVSSTPYKLVMLLILLSGFFINWSIHQSLDQINSDETQRAYFLLSGLGPLLFLFFCHIMVRTFLKLKLINQSLKLSLVLQLGLFFLMVSTLAFTISYGLSSLDVFKIVEIQKEQFLQQSGIEATNISNTLVWSSGIFSYFIGFVGWSICYLLWFQYQAKKEINQQMQQAQMQQLTNQLSPHFLFNTFNSIRALIYEDKDKAANTVTHLSELFRTHFQAHLRVKSSLQEEWQVSLRYLEIEKIRLEERLNILIDLPETLWLQELPTLTLLTLVENAIKHGVSPCVDGGFIKISAVLISPSRWLLTVTNSFAKELNTVGTQVGLANVKTRLKLMYGDNHQFTQSIDKNEFRITLELPFA